MLQFITHHTDRYDEIAGTRAVLEGGCRWVQLRMKDAPAEEVRRIGREIEKLCREYGAKFILDDHVELVRELNADGVHLGKLDMPVAEARRLLGPEYLIGATANTFEDIERGAGAGRRLHRPRTVPFHADQTQPESRTRTRRLPHDYGVLPQCRHRAARRRYRGHHGSRRGKYSRNGSDRNSALGRTAASGKHPRRNSTNN